MRQTSQSWAGQNFHEGHLVVGQPLQREEGTLARVERLYILSYLAFIQVGEHKPVSKAGYTSL